MRRAMKHKHHIIPRHMGGTDDPDNLIELSVEDHALAHLELYNKHNKKEDLCAYYMLSGKNKDIEFYKLRGQIGGAAGAAIRKGKGLYGPELFYGRPLLEGELQKNCSAGGIVQGRRNAESGHMQKIQKLVDRSALGKKNAEICREKKVNAFFDPELRKEICSKGGTTQGRRNAESGHMQKISQLPNSRNKGKFWITDGVENKMISVDENIPIGFKKGKVQRKNV